jgi:hypothetical protein
MVSVVPYACEKFLKDYVFLAESPITRVPSTEFEDWEISSLKHCNLFDCDTSDFEGWNLKKYIPKGASHYFPGCRRVLHAVVRNSLVELTERLYFSRETFRDSLDRDFHQSLEKLLAFTNESKLLDQEGFQSYSGNVVFCNTLEVCDSLIPFQDDYISLPIKLPVRFFDLQKTRYLGPSISYPELFTKLCKSLGSIDRFIALRNSTLCSKWLGHRISESESLSSFSPSIKRYEKRYDVKGGVISGYPSSGKTTYMINTFTSLCFTSDKGIVSKDNCLFCLHWTDCKVLEECMKTFGKDILDKVQIIWSKDDFKEVLKTDIPKKITIVNSTYMSRSTKCRKFLKSVKWKYFIVDSFEDIKQGSKGVNFIRSVNTETVWLVTSFLQAKIIPKMYSFLRLDQSYPYSVPKPAESVLGLACGRFLVGEFNPGSFGHISQNRSSYMTMHLYPSEDYPFAEMKVAARTVWNDNIYTNTRDFLEFMSKLEGNIPMNSRYVEDSILTFSKNVRPGGNIRIVFPKYEDMWEEILSDGSHTKISNTECGICQEDCNYPTRNSSCDHIFCYTCLSEWNRTNSSCPFCRAPFTTSFYKSEDTNPAKRRKSTVSELDEHPLPHSNETLISYTPLNITRINSLMDFILDEEDLSTGGIALIISHFDEGVVSYGETLQELDVKCLQLTETLDSRNFKHWLQVIISHKVVITSPKNLYALRSSKIFNQVIFADHSWSLRSTYILKCYFDCVERKVRLIAANSMTNALKEAYEEEMKSKFTKQKLYMCISDQPCPNEMFILGYQNLP